MATGETFASRASTDVETCSLSRIRRADNIEFVKVIVPFVASRNEKRKRGRDEDQNGEAHVLMLRCNVWNMVTQEVEVGNK